MSKYSDFFGGGSVPVGSIVGGQFAANPDYLLCDGGEYLKSAYPALDYTGMTTFGSNVPVSRTLPSTQNWSAVAFGNGMFVAVNRDSSAVAASSTDGITWVSRSIPTGIYYTVIYAAGLFVAVGYGVCATSPDGITWTARTMAGAVSSLAYGNGIFVAMSGFPWATGNNASYYTGPDGITWTLRSMPTAYCYSLISWAGDRFIAPAYLSAGGGIQDGYVSVDGINWTNVVPPLTSVECTVEFKGRLYQNSGAVQLMLDSGVQTYYNGYSSLKPGWVAPPKENTSVTAGQFYKAGEWLFSVPNSGTGQFVACSTDGINWRPLFRANLGTPGTGQTRIAYGNNMLVFLPSVSNVNTLLSLSVDTTKFRVPRFVPKSEADRLYIKAK